MPGQPVAKGRPRATGFIDKQGKARGRMYPPDKTAHWENVVKDRALSCGLEEPIDGAISLQLDFYFSRPKSAKNRKYPHVRPDIDNLSKLIMDAVNGVIWTDDARVCRKVSEKHYTDDVRQVGVRVQIMTMEEAGE